MADMRTALWNILNDLEDAYTLGYKNPQGHPEPPPAPVIGDVRSVGEPNVNWQGGAGPAAPPETQTGGHIGGGDHPSGTLEEIAAQVHSCTLCALSATRNLAVPGEGDTVNCRVLVVGEGPGAQEDRQGKPFVGPAGQFLDKWLKAIGLSRNDGAYIANAVKCRPPGNRDPQPDETRACLGYLRRQIQLLRPDVILCVGRVSASILLGESVKMGAVRGKWLRYENIPLMATYHPSAVLRNEQLKRPVWEDLKKLKTGLDSGNYGHEVS